MQQKLHYGFFINFYKKNCLIDKFNKIILKCILKLSLLYIFKVELHMIFVNNHQKSFQ